MLLYHACLVYILDTGLPTKMRLQSRILFGIFLHVAISLVFFKNPNLYIVMFTIMKVPSSVGTPEIIYIFKYILSIETMFRPFRTHQYD